MLNVAVFFPMTGREKKINYHSLRIMLILRILSKTQFGCILLIWWAGRGNFNNISGSYFRSIRTQILTKSKSLRSDVCNNNSEIIWAKRSALIKWMRRIKTNKISLHSLFTLFILFTFRFHLMWISALGLCKSVAEFMVVASVTPRKHTLAKVN